MFKSFFKCGQVDCPNLTLFTGIQSLTILQIWPLSAAADLINLQTQSFSQPKVSCYC